MDYQKTKLFNGDPQKALDVARNVFIQHSFEIVNNSSSQIEFLGTRSMWGKNQDPIIGVSRISIGATSSQISIEAEFGSIKKAMLYLSILIIGLALFFLVLFGMTFKGQDSWIVWMAILPLAPWIAIGPLMYLFLKYRTNKALDTLMNNMEQMSKS